MTLGRFAACAAFAALLCAPSFAKGPTADEKKQALEIYREIVNIDSSTDANRVPEVAKALAKRFRDGGFDDSDIHLIPFEKTAALVVRYRGDGRGGKPILFMAHMDVVTAKRADWERDPFTLIEEKGYFFGRGTADNKSGIATMSATFLALKREKFKPSRDLVLVLTGDEETTGKTAMMLLKDHRDLVDAEFAINSDGGGGNLDEKTNQPTIYGLQTAEKSYASYTLTARNEGGHSSAPRPDNAIYELSEALLRVRAHTFPVMWNATTIEAFRVAGARTKGKMGEAIRRFASRPGDKRAAAVISSDPFRVGQVRTTCVATLLEGGHADNALPQRAVATVNCRIFPGVTVEAVQRQLQKLVGAKIAVAPLDKYFSSDASPLRKDVLTAVTAAVHANYPKAVITPAQSSGATDGLFFRNAGIPTYGASELFSKDSDDLSHGLNERVPVDVFYKGLTHWRVMIQKLAGR